MFGRKKADPEFLTSLLKRIFIGGGILIACILLYRVVTAKESIKNQLEHARSTSYNRLLTLVYPLDSDGTKAFASLLALWAEKGAITTSKELLHNLLRPVQEKSGPLFAFIIRYFPEHARLIHELALLEDDVASLLGMDREQTYLIVLQNTAEKRPNGGFFGSFALVTFSRGKIIDLTVSDSYHPAYNRPTTKILGPERLQLFLPQRDIYFIGANKVGFTYHDGPHIKTLYEKSYPGRKIRGVVFLRTDMFEKVLPSLTEQLWTWQYMNATVDLRRGEERRGKKEYYLSSLQEYLSEHRMNLVQELWMQLPTLLEEHKINIYLENVSGAMHTLLRTRGLTTRFEEDHAYFWDSNTVFNKLDMFVTKTIQLIDSAGKQQGMRTGDIIQLPKLMLGERYTFVVSYTLKVPEQYHAFIRGLNEEFGLVLGQREEHILGVDHEWETRGNIYFPPTFSVENIQGDISSQRTFATPFSQNAAYESYIGENNQTNTVRIQVLVQE